MSIFFLKTTKPAPASLVIMSKKTPKRILIDSDEETESSRKLEGIMHEVIPKKAKHNKYLGNKIKIKRYNR